MTCGWWKTYRCNSLVFLSERIVFKMKLIIKKIKTPQVLHEASVSFWFRMASVLTLFTISNYVSLYLFDNFISFIDAVFVWPVLLIVSCNPIPATITRPCFGQFSKRSMTDDAIENGCLKEQTNRLSLYLEMARNEMYTSNKKVNS